jgi:hypothetical protein
MKSWKDTIMGELVNADSNKVQNGKAFKTSGGRLVYSGGGIMPDNFCAIRHINIFVNPVHTFMFPVR